MGLILGLIGMHVASVAVEKITDTVSDVSYNIRSRSREKAEIQAESRRYVAREQTKREIALAQIEAELLYEIERTRAQARIMEARTKNGFFGSLYGRQNVEQIGYASPDEYSYQNEYESQGEIISEVRYCPYCGQSVNSSDRYCNRCGGRLQ